MADTQELAALDSVLSCAPQMQRYAAQRRKQVALLEALAARGMPPNKLLASALAAAGVAPSQILSPSGAIPKLTPRAVDAMLSPATDEVLMEAAAEAGLLTPGPPSSAPHHSHQHSAGHRVPDAPPALHLPGHALGHDFMLQSYRNVHFRSENGAQPAHPHLEQMAGAEVPHAGEQLHSAAGEHELQQLAHTSAPGDPFLQPASHSTLCVPHLQVEHLHQMLNQLQRRRPSPPKQPEGSAASPNLITAGQLPAPPPGTLLPTDRSLTPSDLSPFIAAGQADATARASTHAAAGTSGLASPTSHMHLFAVMDARKEAESHEAAAGHGARPRCASSMGPTGWQPTPVPQQEQRNQDTLAPLAIQVLGLLASQHGIDHVAPLAQRSWSPPPTRIMAVSASGCCAGGAAAGRQQPLPFSTCASPDVPPPVLAPRSAKAAAAVQQQEEQSHMQQDRERTQHQHQQQRAEQAAQQEEGSRRKHRHKHKQWSSGGADYVPGSPHPAAQPPVYAAQPVPDFGNLSLDWLRGDRVPREKPKGGPPSVSRNAARASVDVRNGGPWTMPSLPPGASRQMSYGAVRAQGAGSSGRPLTPTQIHDHVAVHDGVALALTQAGKGRLANVLRHSAPPGLHVPRQVGGSNDVINQQRMGCSQSGVGPSGQDARGDGSQHRTGAGSLSPALPAAFKPRMVSSLR